MISMIDSFSFPVSLPLPVSQYPVLATYMYYYYYYYYYTYQLPVLSSQKLVRNCGKAIKKAVIFSQILESSKSSEVHSTERNLPLEAKLSCNFVKESLNFSNLVFSNLCSSYLWRICLSSRTIGKQT